MSSSTNPSAPRSKVRLLMRDAAMHIGCSQRHLYDLTYKGEIRPTWPLATAGSMLTISTPISSARRPLGLSSDNSPASAQPADQRNPSHKPYPPAPPSRAP